MYKTILISNSATESNIKEFITGYSSIDLIATANSVTEALGAILRLSPDLIFLQIELIDGSGFEILDKLPPYNFKVIFLSNSDTYALGAYTYNPVHFLKLPLKEKYLEQAINRLPQAVSTENHTKNELAKNPEIIVLPTLEGFMVIKINEIVRCEADDNYTRIFLLSKKMLVVSKSLAQYEKLLIDLHFARIHHKHLVNLYYIKRYVKGRGGYVILHDDSNIDVSARKKEDFLQKLKEFARQT